MKYIVVVNLNANSWLVLDMDFENSPQGKVFYSNTYYMDSIEYIEKCEPVEIENELTGAVAIGIPLKVKD